MPSLQLYDTLLQQPLFFGLGRNDLSAIVTQTRFGFHKATDGETIIREGELCNKLFFLTNGALRVESRALNHRYTIIEELPSPVMLQPERLFGLQQRHTKTFSAIGTCNLMTLDKNELMKLADNFQICRFNLFNIISAVAQRSSDALWRSTPLSVRDRIIFFLEQRCMRPAGEKHIKIRMEDLADEISDSRLNVSKALNVMQKDGILSLTRGMIHIPRMEMMIQICNIR